MIRFDGQVAIVTGAGSGLGRAHALALAARGARVLVNDLSPGADGPQDSPADIVAGQIRALGGQAIAHCASVSDEGHVQSMIARAREEWGRIDILVNNAGILRDKTFAKMPMEDFRAVIDVHLMGAVHCTKAVWPIMQEQKYGRIVFTTSSSGLYGNFGQSNYGAAKMALVGLMQTLGLEGTRYDIRVNCLAPTAWTQMTHGILDGDRGDELAPDRVSPGLLVLASAGSPNRCILLAGAGSFEIANIGMTQGLHTDDHANAAEWLAGNWLALSDRVGELLPQSGLEQAKHELGKLRHS